MFHRGKNETTEDEDGSSSESVSPSQNVDQNGKLTYDNSTSSRRPYGSTLAMSQKLESGLENRGGDRQSSFSEELRSNTTNKGRSSKKDERTRDMTVNNNNNEEEYEV